MVSLLCVTVQTISHDIVDKQSVSVSLCVRDVITVSLLDNGQFTVSVRITRYRPAVVSLLCVMVELS